MEEDFNNTFRYYVDSLTPTLRLCESGAKLRKNVIGGAVPTRVFQHKKQKTPDFIQMPFALIQGKIEVMRSHKPHKHSTINGLMQNSTSPTITTIASKDLSSKTSFVF